MTDAAQPLRAGPDWCLHFSGLINDCCDAGVRYADVRQPKTPAGFLFPCLTKDCAVEPSLSCAQRQMPSADQIKAWDDFARESLRRYLDKEKNFICPICDAEIVAKEQVGRCVYAHPCGHRLYQGKLPGGVLSLTKPPGGP